MSSKTDAILALVKSKAALEAQCDAAGDDTLPQLEDAIHKITSEIGALETTTLNTATYIPQTDAFKKATAEGQAFLTMLNNLKTAFAAVGQVAGAIDSIISLITKLGL